MNIHIMQRNKSATEERKQKIVRYLKRHRNATWGNVERDGLIYDLRVAYQGKINDARRDAGLIPDGYITRLEAAEILGVRGVYVTQLAREGMLNGYRVVRNLYVSLEDVQRLKQEGTGW